jgi:hypothetical protein
MAQGVPIFRFLNNSGDTVVALDIYNMGGQRVASRNNILNGQTVDFDLQGGGRYRLEAHQLEIAELNNVNFNSTVVLTAQGQLVVIR